MSRLPQEIIVDILTYLPAKSLIRFKLLVATDPLYYVDFEAASDGDNGNTLVKLPYPNAESHNDSFAVGLFLGSCDGIVCILNEVDNVVLWNPSTRESKKLSGPSSSLYKDFSTGLGYDSSADDYKIVITSSATATGSDQIMVELWLGKQEGGAAHDLDVIVPFDIEEEKFMEAVPLPNHFYTAFLSILGNCLCVFGKLKPSGSCFEAWLASEYNVETSWKRLFVVPVDKLYPDCYSTEMWLTKKGEVLVDNHGCPGKLTLYHPVEDARRTKKHP
ncbi:F-box/kelch-repeat protein [Populus alba x Populus x berolinensis]|nr:F-box/kelch-repeat protein [Populus alba x Populus x berolinensis]